MDSKNFAARIAKKWKVPGMDGLPAEFYLKFWGILGPVVLEVLKAILETGVPGGINGCWCAVTFI